MSAQEPASVGASDEEIREAYGKISKIYKLIEEKFEKKARERGLELLDPREGERILEIGFGTGCALVDIARSVGEEGMVYGIDVSKEMVELAEGRVKEEGLSSRVEILEGDARCLSYEDSKFDAVYMGETLELFDTPDIPKVLNETERVLKEAGRLGIVSMCRKGYEGSSFVRIYEWFHQRFPKYLNCRPIYVEDELKATGYEIKRIDEIMSVGICPMKIVIARPEKSAGF